MELQQRQEQQVITHISALSYNIHFSATNAADDVKPSAIISMGSSRLLLRGLLMVRSDHQILHLVSDQQQTII
jgi:hypothetical protein